MRRIFLDASVVWLTEVEENDFEKFYECFPVCLV